MSFNYKPYRSANKDLKRFPNKTRSQKLTRERMAEEHMKKASVIGKRLVWTSFATNLVASTYLAASSEDEATIVSILSALASAAPLFVKYNWEEVYDAHNDYKKRIYGPVSSTGILKSPSDDKPVLGLITSFTF